MSKINRKRLTKKTEFRRLFRARPVKVIAVTSGKGGVGKSTVALNLAIALTQKNKKVLLLDADLGLPNLDVFLGLQAEYNLSHLLQGICQINDIIVKGPGGVHLIPGSSDIEFISKLTTTEYAGIIDAFNELTDDWDYLIIDTAAGISDTVLNFTRSAQELMLVITDEPASLTGTYSLLKLMNRRYQCRQFHVLVNKVMNAHAGRELFNKLHCMTGKFLDVQLDYLGTIPFDSHVHQAIISQESVMMAYPNSIAASAINQITLAVDEWPVKLSISGNTCFFVERMVIL